MKIIFYYVLYKDVYNKKYNWATKPQIVLCDDAKVSKKDVQLAMEYWKDNSLDGV